MMTNPENEKKLIWFVKASDPNDKYETFGSAVAIRLQKIDDPQSADTYLITCAHVLRGKTKDQKAGYGAPLPQIQVWKPGTAYNQSQEKKVSIVN